MKNIIFFVRHFSERGTETSIYNYAKYNEEILKNKSYIVAFTEKEKTRLGLDTIILSYEKFNSSFKMFEINNIEEISNIIEKYKIDFFYTLTHGGPNDIYKFENKEIWRNCKTIKHCVFDTQFPEGDFCITISDRVNNKYNTKMPILPYIVDKANIDKNLKKDLNIPENAIVIGRYGGFEEFNIQFVYNCIQRILEKNDNIYFLFMNTKKFYKHPRIIYLEYSVDIIEKTKFINTCSAMIHARSMGEIFGLSVGEFSLCNKPIITCYCGYREHIDILKYKAIIYNSEEELNYIFDNIESIIKSRNDWNAYQDYSPEKVMKLFDEIIFKNNNYSKEKIYNNKNTELLDKSISSIYKITKNDTRIIDCFIFYNEIEILLYRLNILNDIVDYFVIVESSYTFSGKIKPLYFNGNKELFEKFKDKIIHIIIDDFPYKHPNINYDKKEQWNNEFYQRNYISIGLNKMNLKDKDLIIISDVDEIPNPNKLNEIKNKNIEINTLEMDFYYYNLNTICYDKWDLCKILSFKTYKELNIECNTIRNLNCIKIQNGGWHLSYFGDSKFISNKIKNFSHQEYNKNIFTDTNSIEKKIKNSEDLFDRKDNNFKRIPISENVFLPSEYEKYLKKFFI
jgi:beta-1,4-mannosyl-glycoprotein beta-1,4-N-acetylglucosaminyltransferase